MQNKINQSGRSMVEMLGVLAIIGVLSVGGIAGYTTAMNKHRANEILNAASVRAMMITTQLAQGRKAAELSLAEFGEEKVQGVSFDKEYTDGAETFNLKLTWDAANPSVCTQIKNIVGENVTVDTECTTFTYKNEFGGGTGEGGNTPTCVSDTSLCANGSTDGCTCDVADQTETCSSWKENVCGSGYYCDFKGRSCTSGNPNGTGVCKPVDGTYGISTITSDQSQGHWYTKISMDQWSANSWCLGKTGKGLIGFTGLQAIAGSGVVIDPNYNPDTYPGSHALYKGFCGTGTTTCLPEDTYWTSMDYEGDSTSCYAYRVYVNSYDERVGGNGRTRFGPATDSALCE